MKNKIKLWFSGLLKKKRVIDFKVISQLNKKGIRVYF